MYNFLLTFKKMIGGLFYLEDITGNNKKIVCHSGLVTCIYRYIAVTVRVLSSEV